MMILEQRITDLQSVIGTLQSFVRDGTAPPPGGVPPAAGTSPGGNGGAPNELSIRVLALETQIRALTGQMEQINARLNNTGAGSGSVNPLQQGQPPETTGSPGPQGPNFSTLSPSPSEQDSQGGAQFGAPAAPALPNPFAERQQAQVSPPPADAFAGSGSRGIYDAAYQSYLQADLANAEQGFRNFVETYPDDPLVTNAYYWLGRSYFDRKQYEPAAKAFLAGYKKDKKSAIAPDSLLHLGLALSRLGEKDAACSTLQAIERQYPQSPERLREDAAKAIRSAGC